MKEGKPFAQMLVSFICVFEHTCVRGMKDGCTVIIWRDMRNYDVRHPNHVRCQPDHQHPKSKPGLSPHLPGF